MVREKKGIGGRIAMRGNLEGGSGSDRHGGKREDEVCGVCRAGYFVAVTAVTEGL